MSKKWMKILVLFLLASFILVACSPAAPEATAPEPPSEAVPEEVAEEVAEEAPPVEVEEEEGFSDVLVIYVTSKPMGTNRFHLMGREALDLLEEAYGVQTQFFESEDDPTNREENVRAAVNTGANIIYVLGNEWGDIVPEVASENPDIDFLIADQCVPEQLPNVHCVRFKEYEASFLLGVMAGSLTEAGRIGAIGALDIPFLHRYTDGFVMGAEYVNPEVLSEIRWVGGDNPFGDPARAKEQALAIYATGADYIFSATAGGDPGVFEGAKENEFFAFGVDVNHCPSVPGFIVDNLLKHIDKAILNAVGILLTEDVEALNLTGGVADGAVGPGAISGNPELYEGCVIMNYPEVISLVEEVRDKIINEEIEIPDPMFAQ